MIRPITLVCFLFACASGLYLYQEKHRVQMIDREIEKTVHATEAIREQTRVLHAEWTLLNDPQRLQALADQFLSLKTVAPGQFTSLADLDNRLPAVRAPEPQAPPPSAAAPTEVPVAQQALPAPPAEAPPAPAPVADKPVVAPVVAAVAPPRPVEHKPAPAPAPVAKPQVAVAAPANPAPRSEPKPVERRPVIAEVARPMPPRVLPAAQAQPAAPIVGSALGMAHNTFVPPPRPMPVNASQWVAPGGGGGG